MIKNTNSNYSSAKYNKYKKKQELLNRKQVNLTLDKDLAEILQKKLKGEGRNLFEYQLKSHFTNKASLEILDKNHSQLEEVLPKICILMQEMQEEIEIINSAMKLLAQKVKIMTEENNIRANNKVMELKQENTNLLTLDQESN